MIASINNNLYNCINKFVDILSFESYKNVYYIAI